MMQIDDDLLMALADGELDDVTRARVERAVGEDPALKARLEVQQRLRARLAAHYAPAVEEKVPERLRAMLETNVVGFAPARRARPMWQSFAADRTRTDRRRARDDGGARRSRRRARNRARFGTGARRGDPDRRHLQRLGRAAVPDIRKRRRDRPCLPK